MKRPFQCIVALFCFMVMTLCSECANAQMQTVAADASYTLQSGETKAEGEAKAVQLAQIEAAERLNVYINSVSAAQSSSIKKDEIISMSMAIMKIESKQLRWHVNNEGALRVSCHLVASADSDQFKTMLEKMLMARDSQLENDILQESQRDSHQRMVQEKSLNESLKRNQPIFDKILPDSAEAYEKGVFLKKNGDIKGAKGSFRRALAFDKYNTPARLELLELLNESGESAEAKGLALKGIKQEPANPDLYVMLGWAEYNQSHYKACSKAMEKADAMNGQGIMLHTLWALAEEHKSHSSSKAIEISKRALKLHSDDGFAYYMAGKLYVVRSRAVEEKLKKVKKQDVFLRLSAESIKELAKAVEMLDMACQLGAGNKWVNFYLGEAHYKWAALYSSPGGRTVFDNWEQVAIEHYKQAGKPLQRFVADFKDENWEAVQRAKQWLEYINKL